MGSGQVQGAFIIAVKPFVAKGRGVGNGGRCAGMCCAGPVMRESSGHTVQRSPKPAEASNDPAKHTGGAQSIKINGVSQEVAKLRCFVRDFHMQQPLVGWRLAGITGYSDHDGLPF